MRLDALLTALPFGVAFIFSMLFGPSVIDALKRRRVGQTISEDGPESHKPKAGTPTMGGIIILAGIFAAAFVMTLVLPRQLGVLGSSMARAQVDLMAVLVLMLGYALLGVIDDYLTINPRGGVRGIASKPKAALQVLLAVLFVLWLAYARGGFDPSLYIASKPILSGVWYYLFSVVFLVGMANFVNITDGLDGLVAGLTAIASAAIALTIVAFKLGVGDSAFTLLPLISAIAGACVAFLWFNANPAKVFMGDTGALALGIALPAVSMLVHREVLLIVVGLVFIVDGLSTAIQWAVFKYTRVTTGTGRRVFKKSPIHHHFEMSGWAEQNVVVRFWMMGVVAAVIGFAGAALGWW